MSSNYIEFVHENPLEIEEYYDQHWFLLMDCQQQYYANLASKKLLQKVG